MTWVILAAMATCLAIGFYCGWIARDDRHDAREHEFLHPAGRHAASRPLRLRTTDQLAVLYGKPYPLGGASNADDV